MKAALWFGLGGLAGAAAVFWLKPPSKEYCCQKVSEGARDKVKDACGPLGDVCAGIGDLFNLWDHAPSLLERLGL